MSFFRLKRSYSWADRHSCCFMRSLLIPYMTSECGMYTIVTQSVRQPWADILNLCVTHDTLEPELKSKYESPVWLLHLIRWLLLPLKWTYLRKYTIETNVFTNLNLPGPQSQYNPKIGSMDSQTTLKSISRKNSKTVPWEV